MRAIGAGSGLLVVWLATIGWSAGQERGGSEPDRSRPPVSGRGESSGSESRYRSESRPDLTATAPQYRGSPAANAPGAGLPPGHEQQYNPGYYSSPSFISGYYDCQSFLWQLWRQYGFIQADHYLWRYSQGDSPLSEDVVKLALQESAENAAFLVRAAQDLNWLLAAFETGAIDRATFQGRLEGTLEHVRKLAKRIRGDYRLEYIDQRTDINLAAPPVAGSTAELRALVDTLVERSRQIEEGLLSFYRRDLTRVVSVADLAQPSFKSISKNIDRLAKVIEKSAERL